MGLRPLLCLFRLMREHVKDLPLFSSILPFLKLLYCQDSMEKHVMFLKRTLLFILSVFVLSCASQQRIQGTAVIQLAHSSAVNCVAFSKDGRLALSGSSDNTLKLWEVATGREIRTLIGHSSPVTAVSFSPDDRFALSGSGDGRLIQWEVATGHKVRTHRGFLRRVDQVAFSPDGQTAVSLSTDKGMMIWKFSKRSISPQFQTFPMSFRRTYRQHWTGPAAITPDGRYAISANYGNSLKLWEISSGRTIQKFKGAKSDRFYTPTVYAAAVSPDGRFALLIRKPSSG